MKPNGIQQQPIATINFSELDVEPVVAEPKKPSEKAEPDRPEQMKSSQQHATERKSNTQIDAHLRRMQLQRAVDYKPISESTYSAIREKLTYGARNIAIDKSDVADVHSQLQKLSPREYNATIQQMDKDGLLGRYIDNMDNEDRKAFLQQAVDNGYIQQEAPGQKAEGKFDPPTAPALLKNERSLPTAVRDAIHEENVSKIVGYSRSYEQYIGRYSDAVLQAKSGEEIRALGAPVNRTAISEPGVTKTKGEVDYSRFTKDWYNAQSAFPNENRGYQAISDRMHDLTGAKRAGSLWFTSEFAVGLETKSEGSGRKFEAGVEAKFEFSPYGATSREVTAKGAAGYEKEGKEGGAEEKGKYGTQVEVGVGKKVTTAPGGIRHESDIEVSGSVGFERKEASVSIENDGTVEGSLALGKDMPHGYSKFNPSNGYMEIGIGHSAESGAAKGQIRLGIGLQGSNPDRVKDAIAGDIGTFGTPPEFERGMSWKALPEERRAYFERSHGWTEKEWMKRLAAQQK